MKSPLSPIEDAERQLIRERAAEWVCELQEDAPERHAAFCAWVRQSPRHAEEFLFAATAWKALDEVGPRDDAQVERAIANALTLAHQDADNVVELPQMKVERVQERAVSATTPWRWAAGLAALALTGSLAWWGVTFFSDAASFTTAVGEQRTVRLADGSVLYLNTESRAKVHYSGSAREVRLLEGEALFVVAHEAVRPFRVISGTTLIQAVGTQFNVERRGSGTTVSVLEGRVKVTQRDTSLASPSTAQPLQLLNAGEEASIAGDGRIVKRAAPDVSDAVAWRERRLVFRGEMLEEVVSEVNRYNSRQFRIEGDMARKRRLAGTFSSDDPEALARFLERYEDLTVERTEEEYVIRER